MKYLLSIQRQDGTYYGGVYDFEEAMARFRLAAHDPLVRVEINPVEMGEK